MASSFSASAERRCFPPHYTGWLPKLNFEISKLTGAPPLNFEIIPPVDRLRIEMRYPVRLSPWRII